MRKLTLMIAFLLLPAAAAQPGPAPGYDSALEYAGDYAGKEAEAAAADPLTYAEDHASREAVSNETSHAAYMACWAADDAGLQPGACEPYYTAPGDAPPEQPDPEPCECQNASAPEAIGAFGNSTINATADFAGDFQDGVNATVDDPQNATSHLAKIGDLVVGFVKGIADGAVSLATGVVEGALACLGLITSSGESSVEVLAEAGGALAAVTEAAGDAVGQAAGDAGSSVTDGLVASLSALGDAVIAAATGISGASMAVATTLSQAALDAADLAIASVAEGGKTVGQGAEAAGEAVADAAAAVRDAVKSMFGLDAGAASKDLDVKPGLDVGVDADGLLDPVTGLLQ